MRGAGAQRPRGRKKPACWYGKRESLPQENSGNRNRIKGKEEARKFACFHMGPGSHGCEPDLLRVLRALEGPSIALG